MRQLIGREGELERLRETLNSDQSELVAIYGRRRVGKTFLIREAYKQHLFFEITGLFEGNMRDQLSLFHSELTRLHNKAVSRQPHSWFDAFAALEKVIVASKSKKKKVIFIDEFPWLATARSKFLMAFSHFWNNFATRRSDLVVVICGSAASFMVNKVIRNKGGLHNRISVKIRLLPFTLRETHLFLKSRGVRYTLYDVVQLYMAIGGVPHYLDKVRKDFSVAQNIDALCFDQQGMLKDEFSQLFSSLFDNADRHLRIVRHLATAHNGVTRNQLSQATNIPSGGDLTLKLDELIESGFVSEQPFYQNKTQLTRYRLSDEYTRFYLKFIESNRHNGNGTWLSLGQSSSFKTWAGLAFESVCHKHILQLKHALRIDSIHSTHSSWFNAHAQIDLLIDRADHVMNVCEIKFYNAPFSIDKNYYNALKIKKAELENSLQSRKTILFTMITTYGVRENEYSKELVQSQITLESLFSI